MSDWCILRTAPRSTMALAASLADDGYDVWTPIETVTKRVPRASAKFEVRLPIMPSYVFARVRHLVDLLQLAELPVKPRRGAGCRQPAHSDFHVLHAFGRIPLVAEKHLAELRLTEAKRTPIKRAAYSFPRNEVVRVTKGIFGGLDGIVVRSTPAKTTIQFGGAFPTEIPTSLLERKAVKGEQVAIPQAA